MSDIEIFLTSTDQIRGAIGLEEADIPDYIITSRNLALEMEIQLAEILPGYDSVSVEATENQMKLWCMYWGALQMVTTGRLAIMQSGSANQDDMKRFDINWDQLVASLKGKLEEIEDILDPSSGSGITIMSSAVPDYDPITDS